MKESLRHFQFTIGCFIGAVVCWVIEQFTGSVCSGGRYYQPGLGYQCDATVPTTAGKVVLVAGGLFLIGMIVSFLTELILLARKNTKSRSSFVK